MARSRAMPMDVGTLFDSGPSPEWVAAIVKSAVSLSSVPDPTRYLAALDWALRDEPPPFGTSVYAAMYRAASAHGPWLAVSLIAHAERDGTAARRLWSVAAASSRPAVTRLLKRHAVELSRHVLFHLDLLGVIFPAVLSPALRSQLLQLSPGYSVDQPLPSAETPACDPASSLDLLIEVHIAAIRATALLLMQRHPVRTYGQDPPRAMAILDVIVREKLIQVGETAGLVEAGLDDVAPGEAASLFSRCLRRAIRATGEEPIDFVYHVRFGNYP